MLLNKPPSGEGNDAAKTAQPSDSQDRPDKDDPIDDEGEEDFDSRNVRVLVVEGDPGTLSSMIDMLRVHFWYVHGVGTGKEALAVMRRYTIDVLLLDAQLPGVPGTECLSILEVLGLEFGVPVILMSVDEDAEVAKTGISMGAVDYIIKPASPQSLKMIWQHAYRKSLKKKKRRVSPPIKAERIHWTPQLHQRFENVVHTLGIKNAVPKSIKRMMGIPTLKREQIASHLQKYRNQIKLERKNKAVTFEGADFRTQVRNMRNTGAYNPLRSPHPAHFPHPEVALSKSLHASKVASYPGSSNESAQLKQADHQAARMAFMKDEGSFELREHSLHFVRKERNVDSAVPMPAILAERCSFREALEQARHKAITEGIYALDGRSPAEAEASPAGGGSERGRGIRTRDPPRRRGDPPREASVREGRRAWVDARGPARSASRRGRTGRDE